MIAKLKIADLVAALAGVLLFVSSLLDQIGSFNAYHELLVNVLIVTYLFGLVIAAVTVAHSVGVLPERFPWRAWAAAGAFAVLLNAIFGAVALSQFLQTVAASAGAVDPGLSAGVWLGVAAAVLLFVSVALRDVIPVLDQSVPAGAATKETTAGAPVAGGPYPDVQFGVPSQSGGDDPAARTFGPPPAPSAGPSPTEGSAPPAADRTPSPYAIPTPSPAASPFVPPADAGASGPTDSPFATPSPFAPPTPPAPAEQSAPAPTAPGPAERSTPAPSPFAAPSPSQQSGPAGGAAPGASAFTPAPSALSSAPSAFTPAAAAPPAPDPEPLPQASAPGPSTTPDATAAIPSAYPAPDTTAAIPAGAVPSPPPAPAPPQAPFTPFWAAVPTPRPIYGVEDPSAIVANLQPGTWYAAVAPHSHGLIVQLPTGETGVLVEVADLFRG